MKTITVDLDEYNKDLEMLQQNAKAQGFLNFVMAFHNELQGNVQSFDLKGLSEPQTAAFNELLAAIRSLAPKKVVDTKAVEVQA